MPATCCPYYTTPGRRKKGFQMSKTDLLSACQALKGLKAMEDELRAEITALEDQLKAAMDAQGADELRAGDYKLTYKTVQSSRIDSASLKAELPEIAGRYTVSTTYRRFVIA